MKPILKSLAILIISMFSLTACQFGKNKPAMGTDDFFSDVREIQLTTDKRGHFLHTVQPFSPDDQWLVYDTRNNDTHIGRTCCIEMVNTDSKDILPLYSTEGQTVFGPGVGAVTFNPKKHQVLFIHGLRNSGPDRPYSFSRRTGVSIQVKSPQKPIFLDARDITAPYTPGALRGGTHAHTWSPDGQWISFTYNDDVMTKLAEKPNSGVKDLRMVGTMAPLGPLKVGKESSGEHIDGQMFTVVVSEVYENPEPGSDEIDRAYGDGWIGDTGYAKPNGERQNRAIAFLGDTRDAKGNKLTEVFVVDLPMDITLATEGRPIEGTTKTRPMPPAGTIQKRITYTKDRKYPGVQGPRHPLRSLLDGSIIFFMMKDDNGLVQIYGVSPNGGEIQQITRNNASVDTTFDLSPDGKWLVYGIDEQICITEISSGQIKKIPFDPTSKASGLRAINWSNDGKMIAYNRKVMEKDTGYYQAFVLKPRNYEEGL